MQITVCVAAISRVDMDDLLRAEYSMQSRSVDFSVLNLPLSSIEVLSRCSWSGGRGRKTMSASFAMHFADVAAQGSATFASTDKVFFFHPYMRTLVHRAHA
jgi:hypothetical protein